MSRERQNPSHGYVNCDGFDAVMEFVAKTSRLKGLSILETFWFQLAQAAAPDHGVRIPRKSQRMKCSWLLQKMQAVTPEMQWDLVSRVEPLFHSAWEASESSVHMIDCAESLFPPRQLLVFNDQVRLAICNVLDFRFRTISNVTSAVDTARRFAEHRASMEELDKACDQADRVVYDLSVWIFNTPNTSSNFNRLLIERCGLRAAADILRRNGAMDAMVWAATNPLTDFIVPATNALHAEIVRKSLGTPGLALLMRESNVQDFLLPKQPRTRG